MNNRYRKTDKKSNVVWLGAIAALMFLQAVSFSGGVGVMAFVAVLISLFTVGFVVAFIFAKKKGKTFGSVYSSERAKEKAKHIFMREEFEEEAVGCTHSRGKEKYIQQLDNFLANGLIDKSEYRLLKERHERANIPDNMH